MFDSDNPFDESIEQKYYHIVFNANRDIAIKELESIIDRTIILELLVQKLAGCDKISDDAFVEEFIAKNKDEIDSKKKNFYISSMSSILSKSG